MRKRSYPRSTKLFSRAQQILPGGVDSPVRAFKSVGGTPPDGFVAGLRSLCDREEILLVFDEVISGFRARTPSATR